VCAKLACPRNSLALPGSWKPYSFIVSSSQVATIDMSSYRSTYGGAKWPHRVRHLSMSPRQTARESGVRPKLRSNDERSPIRLPIPGHVSAVKQIIESTQLFRSAMLDEIISFDKARGTRKEHWLV
jgi:hypothetical protein